MTSPLVLLVVAMAAKKQVGLEKKKKKNPHVHPHKPGCEG